MIFIKKEVVILEDPVVEEENVIVVCKSVRYSPEGEIVGLLHLNIYVSPALLAIAELE